MTMSQLKRLRNPPIVWAGARSKKTTTVASMRTPSLKRLPSHPPIVWAGTRSKKSTKVARMAMPSLQRLILRDETKRRSKNRSIMKHITFTVLLLFYLASSASAMRRDHANRKRSARGPSCPPISHHPRNDRMAPSRPDRNAVSRNSRPAPAERPVPATEWSSDNTMSSNDEPNLRRRSGTVEKISRTLKRHGTNDFGPSTGEDFYRDDDGTLLHVDHSTESQGDVPMNERSFNAYNYGEDDKYRHNSIDHPPRVHNERIDQDSERMDEDSKMPYLDPPMSPTTNVSDRTLMRAHPASEFSSVASSQASAELQQRVANDRLSIEDIFIKKEAGKGSKKQKKEIVKKVKKRKVEDKKLAKANGKRKRKKRIPTPKKTKRKKRIPTPKKTKIKRKKKSKKPSVPRQVQSCATAYTVSQIDRMKRKVEGWAEHPKRVRAPTSPSKKRANSGNVSRGLRKGCKPKNRAESKPRRNPGTSAPPCSPQSNAQIPSQCPDFDRESTGTSPSEMENVLLRIIETDEHGNDAPEDLSRASYSAEGVPPVPSAPGSPRVGNFSSEEAETWPAAVGDEDADAKLIFDASRTFFHLMIPKSVEALKNSQLYPGDYNDEMTGLRIGEEEIVMFTRVLTLDGRYGSGPVEKILGDLDFIKNDEELSSADGIFLDLEGTTDLEDAIIRLLVKSHLLGEFLAYVIQTKQDIEDLYREDLEFDVEFDEFDDEEINRESLKINMWREKVTEIASKYAD